MKIDRFEDIEVWQLARARPGAIRPAVWARELIRKIYNLTKKGNFAHDFSLKGQIQDAAGSYHAQYSGRTRFADKP